LRQGRSQGGRGQGVVIRILVQHVSRIRVLVQCGGRVSSDSREQGKGSPPAVVVGSCLGSVGGLALLVDGTRLDKWEEGLHPAPDVGLDESGDQLFGGPLQRMALSRSHLVAGH